MPSDVVQNVIIRIGAEETVGAIFARALSSTRRSMAGVETLLQSVVARANASAVQSAAAFTAGKGDLAAAAKTVVEKARAELTKLSDSKDVRISVEVAKETLDEARIKLAQFVERSTRGARFKWAVALEFKNEIIDEARRSLAAKFAPIQRAIQIPIGIAREKLNTALAEADSRIDRWKRENATVRIAFAVANSIGAVLASATSMLAPLRRLAAEGVNVVIRGSVAGIANAASAAIGSFVSIGAAAVTAAAVAATALSVIAAGIGLAMGAVLGAVVGLRAIVGQAIDDTGNLADRLGATVEGLTALQHAARTNGSSADVMNGAIQRMTRSIGEALRGSDEAAAKFTKLGLSAGELSKMNADQAFERIATQIAGLPSPAERAAAAVAVFGKESGSLGILLSKGATGIADARAEAERMGLVLNRVDVAKIQAANNAMDALTNQLRGYLAQATLAIAPYVQAIADKLLSLMPTGQQVGEFLVGAMESVVGAIAYAADVVNLFIAGWYSLKAAVIAVAGGVLKAIDLVGAGIVKLLNLLPGVELEWTETFSSMADSMAEDAVAAADKASEAYGKFARGDAQAATKKFFDEARVAAQKNAEAIAKNADALREGGRAAGLLGEGVDEAAEKVKKLSDELARMATEGATAGLTELEKQIVKLRDMGADFSDLKVVLAIDAIDVKDQIERALKGVKDTDTDPWAAWERGLDVLDALRQAGRITGEQFDSVRRQLNESLDEQQESLAKKIRDAARIPAEEAIRNIQQAQALMKAGKLDGDTFRKYAEDQFGKGAEGKDKARNDLASGKDAGMTTGLAEATKERLAMLTPMKSIAKDTNAMLSALNKLVELSKVKASPSPNTGIRMLDVQR